MDELSDVATTRRLPAPAGPRTPTGQIPVELPPGPMPAPQPVQPYLPAAPAKASGPVTGQVASIVVTDSANTPPATPTKRRSRVRIILVAALIVAIAAATLVFLSPSL